MAYLAIVCIRERFALCGAVDGGVQCCDFTCKAKRVTGIIQHVHQKVRKAATSVEKFMAKHASFNLVEQIQKIEEEVCTKAEKLVKIVEDFSEQNMCN